ncbi:MAG: MFS transporter [Sandaracinaceae bacterium]|nr:MFS transporter [Sandaracinaceae bacterium]
MTSGAPTTNRALTVAALLASMFMAAMEATVVATAMPTVISELGGLALYGWVGAAYLLASTVTVPFYGKLADRHGRKPILSMGVIVFLIGSVASGASTSIEQLIVFRAVQGLGAGAMQPIVLTVIGDLYTPAERGRVQGFFGAVWGIAGVAGPLLGGAIVSMTTWRWVFWINVPLGLLALVVLGVAFREAPRPKARTRLDLAGAGTVILAALSILLAASGVLPLVTGPAGAVLLVVFVWIESHAEDPVLPIALIRRRLITVAGVVSLLLGAAMMAVLTFLPLHVQGVLSGAPTDAGLVIAPMLVGWPVASAITSRMIVRIGYRAPIRIGVFVSTVGFVSLALTATLLAPAWALGLSMLVFGAGMGLSNTALIISVQASVGYEQRGVVTAFTQFARTMGGALGVGALGAVLAAQLGRRLPPETVRALLDPHAAGVVSAPGVAEALGGALAPLFWAGAAATVFALIAVIAQPADESPAAATA